MTSLQKAETHDPSCTVTVLSAGKGNRLCKKFIYKENADPEVIPYGNAKDFLHRSYPVTSIYGLARRLKIIEKIPHYCVVRGDVLPEFMGKTILRRQGSYIQESPKRWALVDMDNTKCPPEINPLEDPQKAISYLVNLLPREFHGIPFFWQWSSSFGVFPKKKLLKAHLWFWLDRPYSSEELRHWAKSVNENAGYKMVDPQLFSSNQIHYTAAPIFKGMTDPVLQRSGFFNGGT